MENLHPLEVTNPSLLRISATSCRVCSSLSNVRSMATALLLLGLLSAFSLQVLILLRIACSCLSIKCSGLPSLNPIAFFACRADFVLAAISSASYCDIADSMCSIILLACGKSQNTISTSFSRRFDRKETFLASRSSLATISVASVFLQRLNAS